MKQIIIYLRGGVVQDIEINDDDVEVILNDFDIEGVPREGLTEIDSEMCCQTVWTKEDAIR